MDFTAQILQSASRARKAFYECGWAEAKVLIRPSDGKFERTPFFDTIIRRGLRNSTRFDASTLTEEEIEALGMHRDETLGFKLQIRHFRSRRKELPPQGRGGRGGVETVAPSPAAAARPHSSTTAVLPPAASTGGRGGGAHAPARESACRPVAPEPWGDEGRRSTAALGGRCPDDAGWHRGGGRRAVDTSGRDRWTAAWGNSRRWNAGGDAAENGEREPYAGTAAPAPAWTQAPAAAAAVAAAAAAAARGRPVWEGPPGRMWELDRRAGSWEASPADGRGGGDGDDLERAPNGAATEGEGQNCLGGGGGGGVGGAAHGSSRRQTEAEIRASFRRHVERLRVRPGGIIAPSGVGGGGEGLTRDVSTESAETGNGGLLTQGYLRLAAMNEHNGDGKPDGGGDRDGNGVGAAGVSRNTRHPSPVSRFDVAESSVRPKRPAEGLGGGRGLHDAREAGPQSQRPLKAGCLSGGEGGPVQKKRRPSEDGNDAASGGTSAQVGVWLTVATNRLFVRNAARLCSTFCIPSLAACKARHHMLIWVVQSRGLYAVLVLCAARPIRYWHY